MSEFPERRQAILDAALHCFLERGYAATSIADLRTLSGASTGSIYHFFGGKSGLAEALFDQAIAGWGAASMVANDPAAPAELAVKGSVQGLCSWGLANPQRSRFLEEMRTQAALSPDFAAIRRKLELGHQAGAARYRIWMQAGHVRDVPWSVAHSLMLGPVYNYLKAPARTSGLNNLAIAEIFATAAWDAVRL